MYYAHSRNARGERQDLVAHLRSVADLASAAGAAFDCAELCRHLGLWHDLGKFSSAFQSYLAACDAGTARRSDRTDHKAAGARLALKALSPLAIPIHGHHGGLANPKTDLQRWLAEKGSRPGVDEALARAASALPEVAPGVQLTFPPHVTKDPLAAEFLIRILFSALVDADFLDTERHFGAYQSPPRGSDITIAELWQRFESRHARLPNRSSGQVADARRRVYDACLASAEKPQGVFRLTVPTGGGKTLSGMAFALRHALKHGLRRVVVAVPFISITDQTARVYRDVFGTDERGLPVVLEHHSAAFGGDGDEFDPTRQWQRLAAENWDAPIVVTTTVQLFESLFAASTSSCRKLHNLARSILILDEAQSLPSYLLEPILDGLRELTSHYGSTVVISTATQPAFESIKPFKDVPSEEIVPEPARLFADLRRVTYKWHTDREFSWNEIAALMAAETQVMTIVNTKKDALALLDALGDSEALHLSTLLCGAHRKVVLETVKHRLDAGERCRLVATQVVEAGVDLDFPVVFRALGPLDSVIQAAGRCNREGRLASGRVLVFRPEEGGIPNGAYRTAAGVTASLLTDTSLDPNDPGVSRAYFKRLFDAVETDRDGIQKLRSNLDYPEVQRQFRMIDDDTESVVVMTYSPVQDEEKRNEALDQLCKAVDALRAGTPDSRRLLRQIQPYLVNVRRREAERLVREGIISPIIPGLGEWTDQYDPVRGLGVVLGRAEALVW